MTELLAAADLVVGTFNNPLIEAKVLGKPVISFQPGLNPKYKFLEFLIDTGAVTLVTHEQHLSVLIAAASEGAIRQENFAAARTGSADNVIALL